VAEWPALAVLVAYASLLLGIALWAERRAGRGRRVASSAPVYVLAQAIYCTTWTYYGSVGFAASSGLLFLAIYLGPTLAMVFGWSVLRRLVRIKDRHRVTGLPDMLALRYGRSPAVAALATVILVVGLVPYVGLQLKTIIASSSQVVGRDPAWAYPASGNALGPAIVAILLLFTIAFGLRRVRPSSRHPGLMAALAAESLVKLVAFLAAGAFVTYGLFDGFGDLFRRAAAAGLLSDGGTLGAGHSASTWLAHLLVSAAAILVLPRQFHVGVVESSGESQIRAAMWGLPAYLFAINVFVLPIALGGLLLGHLPTEADTFVLHVPYEAGQRALSWLVYVGGFSAGMSMVVVETTALATAVSNHIVLPLLNASARLRPLLRRQLVLRWAAAAAFLGAAFLYERTFGASYELVSIGLVSFAAVLQLAPSLLAGLYGRNVSTAGALAGLGAGFATWAYTLVLPVFARGGWLPAEILTEGPWGIQALRPQALFDIGGLDPLSHAVLWSLLLNVGALLVGSILAPPAAEERARTGRLVDALAPAARAAAPGGAVVASAREKRDQLAALFAQYHDDAAATQLADACLAKVGSAAGELGALQLAELEAEAETALAGSIGAAAAHAAIARARFLDPEEARAVSAAYAEILSGLRVSPSELQRKIDYHRERERLLAREAAVERFLAEVSAQLATSLDVDATASTVVHLPVPLLAGAAVLWMRDGGERPRVWLAHGDPERERAAEPEMAAVARSLEEVPFVARAVQSRRPVTAGGGEESAAWPAPIRALGPFPDSVTVPLVARRRTLGTLSLFLGPESGLHLPDDLGIAEELAHRCAIALENATLFTDAQEAIRARDEFLAIASHELKTPLTPLRITIQALRRAMVRGDPRMTPERRDQLFRTADRQVHRISGLIDDLLDATRIGTRRLRLEPRPTDLAEAVRAVVERHGDEITHAGCALTTRLAPNAVGEWDRSRLEQVVTNLVTNALKYAPGAAVEITVEADDRTARLVVRDAGPGIAPEDQERVFRPFERAVSYLHVSGFGLGLYIVREIVAAHAGTVRVDSAPGQGAAFVIELPRRHGAA
jgi:signal transduction histidine kinase/Na+/proline symporter